MFQHIDPGEEVIIHTIKQETHLITVEFIDLKTISGSGKVFKFDDISKIERDEVGLAKKEDMYTFFKWGIQGTFLYYFTAIILLSL